MSAAPRFLIIASQKSGTVWLRENLDKHPQIKMLRDATRFFDHNWDKGPEWYFSQFDGTEGILNGEHCPSYTVKKRNDTPTLETVAQRMDETIPDLRLFALLRNPVDRAYSAFIHHMTHGRVAPDADLLEELDNFRITEIGRYSESLRPFVDRFGRRLHVILNDEVRENPNRAYRRAIRHVGADPSFRPPDLSVVVHTRLPPEGSPYRKGEGKRSLTPEERATIYARFEDDISRLEELLGRDLSAWRPDGARSGALTSAGDAESAPAA